MTGDSPAGSTTRCYELRVRTLLGPAVCAYVVPDARCRSTEPGAVTRFRVPGTWDLISLYELLVDHDLDIIAVRKVT